MVGSTSSGDPVAVAVPADAAGVSIEEVVRYDATRSLGNVTFDGAEGRKLDAGPDVLADAWYLAQALIAAESLGAVQTCLDMSVEYAKERFTFGRAIGSYQSIKHELTEVLRNQENTRALQYYAGWSRDDKPEEFPLAASAARSAAGHALDHAAQGDDQRARRDRGHLGARRPAVLPALPAVPAAARRDPRRRGPRGRGDVHRAA